MYGWKRAINRREMLGMGSALGMAALAEGRTLACAEPEGKTAVDIGSRVELFVDDWLIEKRAGVALRLNPPVKREVVLVTDRSWEGPSSAYFTAIQEGDRIRLYYRGFCPADASEKQVTCVVESRDGIRFTRPELGLFAFDGSKKNNILHQGVESHNFAPFLDTNPNVKPEARYKALGGLPPGGLFAFVSPDGIHWNRMRPEPVMTKGSFDSLNIAFWDTQARCYRCYSRTFGGPGVRLIQHCTSKDFVTWSEPEPNRYAPDIPLEHFYTNATRLCPDAPHLYLSFPKRFVPERTNREGYKEPGVSDAVFMTSRDGTYWDRTFRDAWVRPDRDPRNWTQRSNMPAAGIVLTAPDEYSLYITEHYEWPDHRLRRLTVRRNGFASVYADATGGEFTTRPLTFSGKNLRLNAATSAAGSLSVEVQDAQCRPLPGYTLAEAVPFFGDEMDGLARWKQGSDLSPLLGKPVRLRFTLKEADLYALQTTS